jgi:hypothetical protein
MKLAITLVLLLLMGSFPVFSVAQERFEIKPIEVPEPAIAEPNPAEIHENSQDKPCSSCHAPINREIESKLPSHFVTNKECGECHYTQRWIPLRIYSHTSARYRRPMDTDPQECLACHMSNSQFLAQPKN